MLLTKYADYSIRVLMFLAARPGEKVPITVIADTYGISRNHLMKVSQNLARLGYIIGYRGKGGGIALARPARSISLGQVLEKVETNLRPAACTGLPARGGPDGNFEAALDTARCAFLETLAGHTLADIVFGRTATAPDSRSNGTHGDA